MFTAFKKTYLAVLILIAALFSFNSSLFAGSPPLVCQEVDENPSGGCGKIIFPNGSLTKNGNKFTYSRAEAGADTQFIWNSGGTTTGSSSATWDETNKIAAFGSSTIGGVAGVERSQGSHAGIDYLTCGLGQIKFYAMAGTNNEGECVDYESTSNTVIYTTPTGITTRVYPQKIAAKMFISGGGTSASYDVSPAIISQYHLDDNAGNTTVDDAINAHDGTSTSNTSLMTTTGKLSAALHFNEASVQKVDLGSTSDFKFTGDFAIDFWMKHTLSTTSKRVLGSRLSSGTNTGIEVTHVGSTLKTQFSVDLGSSSVVLNSTTTTNTGAWFHVVAQRNGGDCELWINGVKEAGPSTCSGTLAAAGNFYLGSTPLQAATGGYYTGDLDEVRLFSRALTSTEIAFLYNVGTGVTALSGGTNPGKTFANNDATPDISDGEIFTTADNTAGTAITTFDNATTGQRFWIIGGLATNSHSSTIADSGNFRLSAAWTASPDDVLCLLATSSSSFLECGRVDN